MTDQKAPLTYRLLCLIGFHTWGAKSPVNNWRTGNDWSKLKQTCRMCGKLRITKGIYK